NGRCGLPAAPSAGGLVYRTGGRIFHNGWEPTERFRRQRVRTDRAASPSGCRNERCHSLAVVEVGPVRATSTLSRMKPSFPEADGALHDARTWSAVRPGSLAGPAGQPLADHRTGPDRAGPQARDG